MPTFIFNKLVRDKIPEIQRSEGQGVVGHKISREELPLVMARKMIEESEELLAAETNGEDPIGELADLEQLVEDYRQLKGIDRAAIEEARQKKLASKGGFLAGEFIESVTMSDSNDGWTEYYRQNPDKYPEESGNAT